MREPSVPASSPDPLSRGIYSPSPGVLVVACAPSSATGSSAGASERKLAGAPSRNVSPSAATSSRSSVSRNWTAKQSSKDSSDEIRGAKSVSPFVRAGVPLPHVADIFGRRGDRVAPRRGRRGPRGAASPGSGRPTATSRASRRAAPPKPLRRGRRDSSRATDAVAAGRRRPHRSGPSRWRRVRSSTATRGDRAASVGLRCPGVARVDDGPRARASRRAQISCATTSASVPTARPHDRGGSTGPRRRPRRAPAMRSDARRCSKHT